MMNRVFVAGAAISMLLCVLAGCRKGVAEPSTPAWVAECQSIWSEAGNLAPEQRRGSVASACFSWISDDDCRGEVGAGVDPVSCRAHYCASAQLPHLDAYCDDPAHAPLSIVGYMIADMAIQEGVAGDGAAAAETWLAFERTLSEAGPSEIMRLTYHQGVEWFESAHPELAVAAVYITTVPTH